MDLDLSKIEKVFFIGIGGIGISALAKMAISCGMEVSGINDDESPKTLDSLREAGATIFFQNESRELPEADLYVYSDAWLYRGPEIIENAKKTGKPVLSYFEALGQFAKEYKVIAIAGTHGKTTTTAMVAELLVEGGDQGGFLGPDLGVDIEQGRQVGLGQVEARQVQRLAGRDAAHRGVHSGGLAVEAAGDPLEDAGVVAEARPDEFAVVVLAEPVDEVEARQPGRLGLAGHRQPVSEIVAHVVAAEGQHSERIAAQLAEMWQKAAVSE